MNLSSEQRQLLSRKATEIADSIEAGTYMGPSPTNDDGWCGCAAGILLAAAGMAIPRGADWTISRTAAFLSQLTLTPESRSLTGITAEIDSGAPLSSLVEPYRRIASRLSVKMHAAISGSASDKTVCGRDRGRVNSVLVRGPGSVETESLVTCAECKRAARKMGAP